MLKASKVYRDITKSVIKMQYQIDLLLFFKDQFYQYSDLKDMRVKLGTLSELQNLKNRIDSFLLSVEKINKKGADNER